MSVKEFDGCDKVVRIAAGTVSVSEEAAIWVLSIVELNEA